MSRDRAIDAALQQAGLPANITARRSLAGGCIFNVEALTLEDGRIVVAKTGSSSDATIFREEAAGLHALADTKTVAVPAPLAAVEVNGAAALVMTFLERGDADEGAWRNFGSDLAKLHAVDVGRRYGFEMDNHLGSTPQPNAWMDDWVSFNVECRFQHQARLAKQSGVLDASELKRIDVLCAALDQHLPRHPKPALLHGDLWSGNAMPTAEGRIAVIDPAVYVGDGWADIAMMKLFGGFSPGCFAAYAEGVDDHVSVNERIAVYQLYHVLNHCNLFGRGYAGQAMALLSRLGH